MSSTFLGTRATAAVARVLETCTSESTGSDTVFDVMDELQGLIGCDWVAFNWHDTPGRRMYHSQLVASGQRQLDGPEDPKTPDEPFWRWYWSCEPCSMPDRVETSIVVSISDFYTAREWAQHPMFATLGRVGDELLVSYPDAPGRTLRLLFGREGGARFDERERFLMTLLKPHVRPLLASAVAPAPRHDAVLTDRQREVLRLVQLGLANKQIARALRISTGTVRKHLEHIYGRLGVQSRTAALREVAREAGPLKIDEAVRGHGA